LRAQINLSSEPFRKDRVFLVASAAVAAGLAALLIVLVSVAINDRHQMKASLSALEKANRELASIEMQQNRLSRDLLKAGNADVLERSQFINLLLYRKGISWTRLFADLETVVPANVRVISVRPQVDAQDHIALDLVLGAETQKPVVDLLTRFESSEVFGSTAVSVILAPSQTDPLFRYRVTVNYAQKL
jgi:type IV pilus assembly protein PilN